MDDVEVLDLAPRTPRRWLRPALVALTVLAAAVVVGTEVQRERGEQRVQACAEEATAASRRADGDLAGIVDYIRPVLDGSIGDLRAQMFSIVADAASRLDEPLDEAARDCSSIAVFRLHRALDDRRDSCVELLRARADFFRSVAADGDAILDWPSLPYDC